MIENDAATLFGALANPDRLRVIRALVEAGPEGLTAGEIGERIGAAPSRASFHLASLAESQLITSERQSKTIRYRVNFEQIGSLMAFLLEDCCGGNSVLRNCCGVSLPS